MPSDSPILYRLLKTVPAPSGIIRLLTTHLLNHSFHVIHLGDAVQFSSVPSTTTLHHKKKTPINWIRWFYNASPQQQQQQQQQHYGGMEAIEEMDAADLYDIRMKMEEKRKRIEAEKRHMELMASKQREKVGKAAFLQVNTPTQTHNPPPSVSFHLLPVPSFSFRHPLS